MLFTYRDNDDEAWRTWWERRRRERDDETDDKSVSTDAAETFTREERGN